MQSMLLEYFEMLFNEKAKVKQLQQLILELAFKGKLVPRDSNDEPVNILLQKIKNEKNGLIKSGILNKEKSFLEITHDEIPYELPNEWEWVRVGIVGYNLGQKIPDKSFTYIDVGSINKEQGVISKELNVVTPEDAPSRARKLVDYGTIIYSTVRPYLLNIAIIDRYFDYEPIVSTAFAIIHPHTDISNKYIYYYLRSPVFVRYVESKMLGMAYPAINDGNFFNGIIPLPPTNEQIRIVEKLEHLLGLCEQLEVNLETNEEKLEQAGKSIFSKFNNADLEISLSGLKLLIENFDELSITERNIESLRQSILQKAIQGKLVLQDPNDEPASVLLEKIKAEKEQLIKEKKIKKEKPLLPIAEDEIPYELPKGWEWVRLGWLSTFENGDRSNIYPKEHELVNEGIPFINTKNIKDSFINLIETQLTFITEEKFNSLRSGKLKDYDFLFVLRGSVGKMGIFRENYKYKTGFINAQLLIVRMVGAYNNEFLRYYFNSSLFNEQITQKSSGSAQPQLSAANMQNFIIPVPPLNEQKRIVEKVNQLMVLCDELEKTVKQSKQESEILMQAVLQEAFQQA